MQRDSHNKSDVIHRSDRFCELSRKLKLGISERFGENLKEHFKGFRAYILTSNPQLRKRISLQTSKRIPVYNGGLECRLLRYELR